MDEEVAEEGDPVTFENTDPPCAANPDAWFSEDAEDRVRAQRICAGCPLQTPCLERAMTEEGGRGRASRFGIWGGKTAMQRARMAAKTRRLSDPSEKEEAHV